MTRSFKRSVLKKVSFIAAAAVVATSVTLMGGKSAEAQISPATQTQVNAVLASGGQNVIANLAQLAQADPAIALEVLIAGCAAGTNCMQLLIALSPYIDAELLSYLQISAQRFDNTVFNRGGFDIINIAEGGTENPAQTSGTQPASSSNP